MTAMVLPQYGGRCLTSVLGAIRSPSPSAPGPLEDLRRAVTGASAIVLVILDGLGHEQLEERRLLAPTIGDSQLEPITSVAPSTTAAALTSISTGLTPGEHGIVGYRFIHGGETLQALRWTVDGRDATSSHPPEVVAPRAPDLRIGGRGVPYVGKEAFASSSFTRAHLRGCDYVGVDAADEMPSAVARSLEGSRLVLCYHDAIDKVAHAEGLGESYEAAIVGAEQLVTSIRGNVGDDVAIVVTADHGQVDVGSASVDVSRSTSALVERRSGEGRFRWLHAHPGSASDLAERAAGDLEETCWVKTRREVLSEGLLGEVDDEVVGRLGDVAVIPFADVFVPDPTEPNEHRMRSRHGSLTAAEMLVPLSVIA